MSLQITGLSKFGILWNFGFSKFACFRNPRRQQIWDSWNSVFAKSGFSEIGIFQNSKILKFQTHYRKIWFFFLFFHPRNPGFPKFNLPKISNLQPENLDSLKFAVRETRIFQNSSFPKFRSCGTLIFQNDFQNSECPNIRSQNFPFPKFAISTGIRFPKRSSPSN